MLRRVGTFFGSSAATGEGAVTAPPPDYGNLPLITALTNLGLTTGLKLCLDAGDASSYSGSGQSWLDTAGAGYDFFRGLDGSATTTDPTFNGVAGTLSSAEYWSFDGNDSFTYDSANETWMQNLHKDGAQFTLMAWVYLGALSASQGLMGNNVAANTGSTWQVNTSGAQIFLVTNAGSTVMTQTSAALVTAGAWWLVGISLDEVAGTLQWFANGAQDTDPAVYSSPATGNATHTTQIGSRGNSNARLVNGSRMAQFAAWEGRALTASEMTAVFQATRSRFGV